MRFSDLALVLFLLVFGLYGTYQGLTLPELVFPFFLLVLFLTGLYGIYSGLRSYVFTRRVRKMPTTPICSADAGPVAIAGRAASLKPDKSPVSGVPCVYWRVSAGYYYWSGGYKTWASWLQVYDAESPTPFFIQDGTGRIHIDPQGAEMDIHANTFSGYITKHGIQSDESTTMDDRVLQFIESLKKDEQEAFGGDKFIHLTEYYIPENDNLYVLGQAVPADSTSGLVNAGPLEIRKGAFDAVMYIADSSERETMDKHASFLNLRIFGGLALSAACLFLIPVFPALENNYHFTFFLTAIVALDVGYFVMHWQPQN